MYTGNDGDDDIDDDGFWFGPAIRIILQYIAIMSVWG